MGCQQRSVGQPEPAAGSAPASAVGSSAPATPDAGQTATTAERSDHAPTSPPATPQPVFRELTIPVGTPLDLILDTPVASDTSRVEDVVRAHLQDAIVVDGVTVLPAGTDVAGHVTTAVRSGKVKGRAQLAVRFDTLIGANDARYDIAAAPVSRTARATKGKDALKIGGGAAGGAGTAVVVSTRGEEVRLARGAALKVRLSKPLTVRVPVS
jgi:hypothetical protein